jgi:hypothetical protein
MKITAADFFGGFFCGLRLATKVDQFECGDRLNNAIRSAFDYFRDRCAEKGLEPNFRIKLDPIHGDSGTIEEGLLSGIRSDLIGLDNPDFQKFRMKVTPLEAEKLLNNLPGSAEIYKSAVESFLVTYEGELVTTRTS